VEEQKVDLCVAKAPFVIAGNAIKREEVGE
jgi:hypothetical protein